LNNYYQNQNAVILSGDELVIKNTQGESLEEGKEKCRKKLISALREPGQLLVITMENSACDFSNK